MRPTEPFGTCPIQSYHAFPTPHFPLHGPSGRLSATNPNLGCNDCQGNSPLQVNHQCRQLCDKAYPATSSELQVCNQHCGNFVVDHKCCSVTCSSNANTCMNTPFPPAEVLTKKSTIVDRAHARDLTRRGPSATTALLGPRVDYAEVCCKAAKFVLTSAAKSRLELIRGQRCDEDAANGVILVGLGLASVFARSCIFHVNCVFGVAGVAGHFARGVLPNREELY
ncbi:hypothetical protein PG984_013458 [Apiospora sp. TS-2023a]